MRTTTAWSTPHHRLRRSLSSRRSLLVDALANWHQSLRSVSALNFHLRGGCRGWRSHTQFNTSSFYVTTQLSLILSLYAPRYCHTASAGFGRQFAKLRALSRLQRRYGSKKESSPSFHCSPRPRFTHSQATGISPECSPKCHRAAREREATHPRLCRKAVRQPRA